MKHLSEEDVDKLFDILRKKPRMTHYEKFEEWISRPKTVMWMVAAFVAWMILYTIAVIF